MIRNSKSDSIIGNKTITLTEQFLLFESKYSESKMKWGGFQYLQESEKHYYLFLAANNAIIIPKRAFLLPQEEYDVKSFIERKLAEHKS